MSGGGREGERRVVEERESRRGVEEGEVEGERKRGREKGGGVVEAEKKEGSERRKRMCKGQGVWCVCV